MKYRNLLSGILLAAYAAWTPTSVHAEPANEVWWTTDIAANTTWYNTNVYLLHGLVHVLAPATLTIQPGTVIKGISNGGITNGEATSALFVTAGAKIHAVGTPTQPIIFTSEFDDTSVAGTLGIYERGLWGGVVLFGNAVLNTSSTGAGNAASPKYDVFEGLPDNQISGQFVYRFGGNNDADNSGEFQYVSIRHGGYVIAGNKELNGLSMGAVGSGTTIDHVEAYAIADDGFEWFGGTVNTKYLVSAFNDDDAFDTDQGYRGKNQFWFAIQENVKRDNGGEWNGEPNGIAVSNAPYANFQVYNATWVGPGAGVATNSNNGLFIREYSAPRVFNSILTDFNNNGGTVGIKMDTKSGAMLAAGLLTMQETIVNGFTSTSDANSAPLFTNPALSNSTVNPLLVSISRDTNHLLDPRLQAGSPALVSGITPPNDGFYTQVSFKGAFDNQTLWMRGWTALDAYGFLPAVTHAEPANEVWWTTDIAANTTWYNTNVYLLHGLVHVLAPATLTIQPGTVIKGISNGGITNGEATSALFVTAGAKIHAVGTPTQPIIFTSEFDDTSVAGTLGIYERGLWGGVVLFGNAVLNTSSTGAGNAASPKYDVFEGLPDNQISGQFVYRFGGNNDADNSGEFQYVSIRHGGYVIAGNKELNGLSMGAVGSGTTIDHVEAYAIADDGFEWFGGTVNTKYLVSAFNDDDAFDTDQGYRGKNQFWFAIQENVKRDNGGEWNGEPNGIAVSNAPYANFQVYNATWVGPGAGVATNSNNGLFIREYSAPRVFNSILTDFNNNGGTVGIKMDTKSGAMLAAGLLTMQETIVNGFTSTSDANSAPLFTNPALSNSTVNPLLVSISRDTNHLLDPRLQAGSPAQTTSIVPPNNGFYSPVQFKGAFSKNLWACNWTALDAYGFLPGATTIEVDATVTVLPTAPTLTIIPSGGNVLVTYPSQTGFSYQLKSVTNATSTNWVNEGGSLTGSGGTLTDTASFGDTEKYFRVLVQ